MDKWFGWVTDQQGYVIYFVSPTSQAWAKRKIHGFFTDNHGEAWWCNVGYALRTTLHGARIEDKRFSKLLAGDKAELQELLDMGMNVSESVAI